jgi:hypothetical protein
MPKKRTPPTPKTATDRRARSAVGRPATHDWAEIRRQYVRGDDTVTFAHLGTQTGAPGLSAIKKRAGKEKWADLRAEFRNQVGTRVNQMDLETVEDVRLRHVGIARRLQASGEKALDGLGLADIGAFGVVRLLTAGMEAERKARGMEEFTVRIEDLRSPADLKNLSTDQLTELLERRRRARGAVQA